jgi:hypothetical protein
MRRCPFLDTLDAYVATYGRWLTPGEYDLNVRVLRPIVAALEHPAIAPPLRRPGSELSLE